MIIPVCLASDRNYVQHLSVTMASILKNKAESDVIRFYIMENTFIDEDRQKLEQLKSIADFEIEFINFNSFPIDRFPFRDRDRITVETYFRLFIPDLLPHEDKVIYLDCDIVVKHSLAELYEIEPADTYILGVRDGQAPMHKLRLGTQRYINGGVLLVNCKKMREDEITHKFIDCIVSDHDRIELHDQDVLSIVLDENIRYLPWYWNGQVTRYLPGVKYSLINEDVYIPYYRDAYILHYIGSYKPWLPWKETILTGEYFKYLRLTPFAYFEKIYRKKRVLFYFFKAPYLKLRRLRYFEQSECGEILTYYYFGFPIVKRNISDEYKKKYLKYRVLEILTFGFVKSIRRRKNKYLLEIEKKKFGIETGEN